MPLAEATAKLRVHQRVKTALRRLNASEPAAQGAATTSVQPASDTGAEAVDGAEAMASKSRKKRAKSFHNFMSDKGRLRGTSQSLQALSHCSSAMLQDIRGQRTRRETDGSSSFAGVDAAGSASWVESHWVVLSFAARDFSPQQVRRMAGVVAAVVSGRLPLEFIDRCFEEEELQTPLAPAEPMWLDRLQLAPKAQTWTSSSSGVRADAEQADAFRGVIEQDALRAALAPLATFASELSSLGG